MHPILSTHQREVGASLARQRSSDLLQRGPWTTHGTAGSRDPALIHRTLQILHPLTSIYSTRWRTPFKGREFSSLEEAEADVSGLLASQSSK